MTIEKASQWSSMSQPITDKLQQQHAPVSLCFLCSRDTHVASPCRGISNRGEAGVLVAQAHAAATAQASVPLLPIHQRHTCDTDTQDDARMVAIEVREVFRQRKDKLQERRSWPLKETTWEVLAPGARGALKQATLVKGLRRDLLFYHQVMHTQSATTSLPGFFRTAV